MVDFRQEVFVMHRVRVESGDKEGSTIARVRKAGINRSDVLGQYSNQTALIQQPLLEVGEIEGTVMDDRATQAGSILGLRRRTWRASGFAALSADYESIRIGRRAACSYRSW
jgi:hypothetical protein